MLTGGYDNSYAQQVGQQAYNGYMDKLNGVIPDLYNMAYNRYQDEGDDLLTQYSLLGDLRDNEYNRYQDELSNWRYDDETAYDRGRDAIADQRYEDETAYDRGRDAIADQRYNDETAYNRQQDAYSNLVAMIKLTGYSPTASELAAAGMSSEQARALSNQWISENILPDSTSTSGGGSYSSGGGYWSGGSYSSGGSGYDANTAAIQQQLNAMGAGLDVDGIWGPKTQAAYEKYMGGGDSSGGDSSGGGSSGSWTYGEILDAAAAGYTKQQIINALSNRGVQITNNLIETINSAMRK